MIIENRYKVTGTSYVGGMAAVTQCTDIILERPVAIKIMPGAENKRRVHDEINALLKMRSKHVVQIYDVLNLPNGDLAIVQEFINGDDLFEIPALESGYEYIKILWQIASGIADIHDIKVIHRDIKPNNMKIDPEGIVKIFDFGLSRNEGNSAATVGFVGTKGFAAPELYERRPKFTESVDTYAFGATALYLGLQELPDELLEMPPDTIDKNYFAQFPFKLHQDLIDILTSCLNANPTSRPAMRQVCDMLAKHLLFDRHKALVVYQGTPTYLDKNQRSVSLSLDTINVEINYNGFSFIVKKVKGDVYINNNKVIVNDVLPGACVVALGAPAMQNLRKYITFDLSHPEVVL